ncbi:MAG: 3'-5' exonuclease [Minisyncoccales bacterium]
MKDNYRSSEKIISNVNNIIKEINFKIDKKLQGTRGGGESIKVKSFQDLNEEMYNSLYEIKSLLQENESPDEIAILFRVNRIGKQLERMFRKHRIPCHLSKSKGFFEREEIKDILSFIKLKINPDSLFDFERLLEMIEGVGKTKILQLKNIANKNNISVRDSLKYSERINASPEVKEKLSKLYSHLKGKENPIESFLVFFDYINKIREKYSKDGEKLEDKLENIEVLKELIRDYEFNEEGLREFLDSLIEMEKKEKDKNKITLTTIHSAKGLEWKHVYLVGCNETILPSYKEELSKIKKDDELRLFYVAVSRAKDNLTISYSENNGFKELQPSHFLEIIDAEFLDQYDDEDINWLEI